jgi:hypothetical protein
VACARSWKSWGLSGEQQERVTEELAALLVRYPAEVALSALQSYADSGSVDLPSYAALRPWLDAGLGRFAAVESAVKRAEQEDREREPDGGAERRAHPHDRYVFAKVRRRVTYPNDPSLTPSAEWRRLRYPEGMPSHPDYWPPDMGRRVAVVREWFVSVWGEVKARTWFDQCRAADLTQNLMLTPDPYMADAMNDQFKMKVRFAHDPEIVASWGRL